MSRKVSMFGKMIAGLAVVAMMVGSAQASIIVRNTGYNVLDGSISGGTVTVTNLTGFALSGGTKLVVTTATEVADVESVTFDGESLTSIVKQNNDPQQASIWYLDSPTALSGDIVVTYNTIYEGMEDLQASYGMSAVSISGAASGVLGSSGSASTGSGTLTVATDSLVVGSFTTNSGSLINPNDPSTDIYSLAQWSSGGMGASAYFTAQDATTRTSFGFAGTGSRPVATAASFAIPEPASLSMMGVIGIAMLLRRRIVG